MKRVLAIAVLLGVAPTAASACEFHGGPWGMAFARMMHAGPAGAPQAAGDAAAGSDAQAQAQASEVALAALRAQFLQRFNVKVEGEPAAAPASPAPPASSAPPTP